MEDQPKAVTLSRRSTRLFDEEQGVMQKERYATCEDKDREMASRGSRASSASAEAGPATTLVDIGIDQDRLFPTEGLGQQVERSIRAVRSLTRPKTDGRPLNFGMVVPGAIYRSSFPSVDNFRFISTLGLKTIVSLVSKEFSVEFKTFMRVHGIRHHVINMEGTKKVAIPSSTMTSIMETVLHPENQPLLIHCNHGKHRTGCAVGVIRRVAGWRVDQIVEEYKGYAEPKVREVDVEYIQTYQTSYLEGLFSRPVLSPRGSRNPAPDSEHAKMAKFIIGTLAALLIWILTMAYWEGVGIGSRQ